MCDVKFKEKTYQNKCINELFKIKNFNGKNISDKHVQMLIFLFHFFPINFIFSFLLTTPLTHVILIFMHVLYTSLLPTTATRFFIRPRLYFHASWISYPYRSLHITKNRFLIYNIQAFLISFINLHPLVFLAYLFPGSFPLLLLHPSSSRLILSLSASLDAFEPS